METVDLGAPAGALLALDLSAYARALVDREPAVRADEFDAVHKMRVSARRLRSSLRTFAPLLVSGAIADLDVELRWLGGVLGAPRDAEVAQARVLALLAELPEDLADSDGAVVLATNLAGRYTAARATLLLEMGGDEWRRAMTAVTELGAQPPLGPGARIPVTEAVPPLVRAAWRRLARRVDSAFAARPSDASPLLHRARRAAKQVRYAAESCVPAYGDDAQELAEQARSLQDVLGEHQDAVVAQQLLAEVAQEAAGAGASTFAFEALANHERRTAAMARRGFAATWDEASRGCYRRWLRR